MFYLVVRPLETDDCGVLRPGQRIKTNNSDKARQLMEAGILVPFCYWLQKTVDLCQYPCCRFDGYNKVEECNHFVAYWKERLKVLDGKR